MALVRMRELAHGNRKTISYTLCAGLIGLALSVVGSGADAGPELAAPEKRPTAEREVTTERAVQVEPTQQQPRRFSGPSSVYALGPGAGLVEPKRPYHYFENFERFVGDLDPMQSCLTIGRRASDTPERKHLSKLLELISKSQAGRQLLWWTGARGTLVCLVPDIPEYALYLSGRALIVINEDIGLGRQLAFLAHELAHAPQHPMFSDNRYFPIEDQILLRRAREAAAEAWASVVAWELKEQGFEAAWMDKAETGYRSILMAFKDAMKLHDGKKDAIWRGAAAAYAAWFQSRPLLGSYDEQSVNNIQRISGDWMGLVPPRQWVTHEFLSLLGWNGQLNFLDLGTNGPLDGPFYRRPMAEHRQERLSNILDAARSNGAWIPDIEEAAVPSPDPEN